MNVEETQKAMKYKGFQVFQFWDCEWVVAKSLEEAKVFLVALTSSLDVLKCKSYALNENELKQLLFRHGEPHESGAKSESFLERFKYIVDENPATQYFATTEY